MAQIARLLSHRTVRQLTSSLLLAFLYAVLILMFRYRLPALGVALLAALAVYDLADSLWRALRNLVRARRLACGAAPAATYRRPLPAAWLVSQAWLLLIAAALAWRIAYLGYPFLPLALPDAESVAWGLLPGALGAGLLWLIARVWPGRGAPAWLAPASWLDLLGTAAFSALAEELFLRGALQPTLGWGATSVIAALAYLGAFWRTPLRSWAVVLAVTSAALGWGFEWFGNLWGPVLGHALTAAMLLALLWRPRIRGEARRALV